jgi:hypothetical protein
MPTANLCFAFQDFTNCEFILKSIAIRCVIGQLGMKEIFRITDRILFLLTSSFVKTDLLFRPLLPLLEVLFGSG